MNSVTHHAGELCIATVGPWLTVTAKSSNLGKIELELVLQPVDSISGTTSQDCDKIVAGEVTSLWTGLAVNGPHVNVRHAQISWYRRRRSWRYLEYRGLADSGFRRR